MVTHTTLDEFYERNDAPRPPDITGEIGHFNIFETEKLFDKTTGNRIMPYSRRDYYKISWIRGKSRAEYADKVIDIRENALLFATPKIPYHWLPEDSNQTGMFCIFTADFLFSQKSGVLLEELSLFQPGQIPVFQLPSVEVAEIEYIFRKMQKELAADYKYKYDLLRNLAVELIHYGQKLQPMSPALSSTQECFATDIVLIHRAPGKAVSPLESPQQRLSLRFPKDYANRLAVHVNHLNKVLKEVTGSTTTEIISSRVVQEAKILLKQTSWSVADIAYSLGFDDVAHFSHYFKKQTAANPLAFRN